MSAGDFPVIISWLFNNQPIPASMGVTSSQSRKRISTLEIESVAAHHAGNYTCIGANDAGHTSYSSQLLVDG